MYKRVHKQKTWNLMSVKIEQMSAKCNLSLLEVQAARFSLLNGAILVGIGT